MDNCEQCHCALGVAARELPVFVEDETWCPQCFVWKRALLEPERFHARSLAAVSCLRCHMISVDFGLGRCANCGAGIAIALPQKNLGEAESKPA